MDDNVPVITMLNKLDVSTDVFNVKVRIIRLWNYMNYNDLGEVYSVEMVLMDEEGNKMLGSIINEHWQKFKTLIELNSTILITNAFLAENRARNKFMGNPNKVSFNHDTNIIEVNDFVGEPYGFTFADFEDMNNNLLEPFQTVDIIGLFTGSEKPTTFQSKGGDPTPKITVYLQDLNANAINVTFFGDYATQMNDFILNNPEKTNVVIILQFGRFKFWQNKTWASNNFVYSKLFIDEDIEDIVSFKQRLTQKTNGQTCSSNRSVSASVNCSFQDEFLIKNEFNNIAQVNLKKVRSLIILGTIKYVPPTQQWYYLSCNTCPKGVKKGDKKCSNDRCKDKDFSPINRFRILMRVQDPTGIIDLILWDMDAVKILKVTAHDLVDRFIKGVDSEPFPGVLNTLLGKKYAFKIDIKKFNVDKQDKCFGINKFTDDENIISALEKKFNLDQSDFSDSMHLTTGDGVSQDTVNMKDSLSFTGDNTTPVSTGNSAVVPSSNLKRNLVDVYDDDEVEPSNSGTKGPPKSLKGDKEDGKLGNLLIPKIEK